ncbi:hypothetical protein Pla86_52650 (plasmid) [Planctomycetes bacterium Pla86]|nr:hypothetical protein Pla86_52650 [Planctomycetes bacterium Pla86]
MANRANRLTAAEATAGDLDSLMTSHLPMRASMAEGSTVASVRPSQIVVSKSRSVVLLVSVLVSFVNAGLGVDLALEGQRRERPLFPTHVRFGSGVDSSAARGRRSPGLLRHREGVEREMVRALVATSRSPMKKHER